MSGQIRNLGVVSVITLLIWVFAEGESLRSASMTVRAMVASDSPDLVVSLSDDEPWDGSIEVLMDGPTARLDAVRAELRRTDVVELTTRELGSESGVLRMADALRAHAIFRDSGVSIVDADPGTISVEVDRLVRVDATVRVESGTVPLRGLAQPMPATVGLMIPERIAQDLDGPIELLARLNDEAVQGLTPGQSETIFNIPVELPSELADVSEDLGTIPTVSIRLTLALRRETQTMGPISVVVAMPSVVSDQYVARLAPEDQLRSGLALRGPVGIFEQVGAGKRYAPRIDVFLSPDVLSAQVIGDGGEVEIAVSGTLSGVPAGVELTEELAPFRVFVTRLSDVGGESAGGEG